MIGQIEAASAPAIFMTPDPVPLNSPPLSFRGRPAGLMECNDQPSCRPFPGQDESLHTSWGAPKRLLPPWSSLELIRSYRNRTGNGVV